MSDKVNCLEIISKLPKFGTGLCGHRLTLLVEQLKLQEYIERCDKIVITGSNGKGSVAYLCEAILTELNCNLGMFTSPHFLEFSERVRVNGKNVDYAQLLKTLRKVLSEARQVESSTNQTFGVFEILFVVSLVVFKQHKVTCLIMEAGIGGRHDPVSLLHSKLIAVTSVDLEHCEILGNTKLQILQDKMDACYTGGKVVIGNVESTLIPMVHQYASQQGFSVQVAKENITVEEDDVGGVTIRLQDLSGHCIPIGVLGEAQRYNLQTAITLCQNIMSATDGQSLLNASVQAVTKLCIPGRMQKISNYPEVYIDSAHTPDSFELLFNSLEKMFATRSVVFLIGISKGRNFAPLITGVKKLGQSIIVTQADFKGTPAAALFEQIKACDSNVMLQPDIKQAYQLAKQICLKDNSVLVVCGGLFLAAEVAALEQGLEHQKLFLY